MADLDEAEILAYRVIGVIRDLGGTDLAKGAEAVAHTIRGGIADIHADLLREVKALREENALLKERCATAESGLSMLEHGVCARTLAGDQKDWRTMRRALTACVERLQEARALLSAPAVLPSTPGAAESPTNG